MTGPTRKKRHIDEEESLTFVDQVFKKKDTRKVTIVMKNDTYKKLWHFKIENNISTISEIIEEALQDYFKKQEGGNEG